MGKLRQSRFSGNDYWTNLVYDHQNSSPAQAFTLPFDALDSSTTYNLLPNLVYWVKWTMPDVEDEILSFVIWYPNTAIGVYRFKLYSAGNTSLNTILTPDATFGLGEDYIHELPFGVFTTGNVGFTPNNTYYIEFQVPFYGECYLGITDTAIPLGP